METSRLIKIFFLALAGFTLLTLIVATGLYLSSKGQPLPQACTKEAKICPDGSTVGRTGPNCEFATCPVSRIRGDITYTGKPEYIGWSQDQMKNDCTEKGGTFNECGSACDDPQTPCIQVCMQRCEFSGNDTIIDTSLDTSTWKTYRNDEYGFEIKYPSDWIFKKGEERSKMYHTSVELWSPESYNLFNQPEVTELIPDLSISIWPNQNNFSFEQWYKDNELGEINFKTIQVNNITGYNLKESGLGNCCEGVYIPAEGAFIVMKSVCIYSDCIHSQIERGIVESFKFIN